MNKFLQSTKVLLLVLFSFFSVNAFGQTAKYTITGKTTITSSGTIPSGSTATFISTYATTNQLTNGNSATLTLAGYAGKRITSIVLEMRSNASGGAGNMSVVAGTTNILTIPTNPFSNAVWNGSYSTTNVNITKTPSTIYSIGAGESVVLTINATANSLFIYSYTITYEDACSAPTPTWINAPSTSDCPNTNQVYETQAGMTNYVWTLSGTAGTDYTIVNGGNATSNTMTVKYLTKGGHNVTVGYTSGGCAGTMTNPGHVQIVNGVSIGPLTAPDTTAGTNGTTLNASEDGLPTSREWKYSTSATGPFISVPIPTTTASYTPNFPTAGTYYIVCESTYGCGMQRSNAIKINIIAVQSPVITSATTKSTAYGTATDTYQIVGSNTPTSFGATLPSGFTINATGLISKADNVDQGVYNIPITATNSGGTGSATLVWTVTKKAITVSLITVDSKPYDATTKATLNTSTATLNNVISTDAGNVTLDASTYTANYNNKNVGTGKAITITSPLTLGGSRASNYTFTQPSLTGAITKKDITLTGVVANDKSYDGTNTIISYTGGTLNGIIAGDGPVTFTVVGTFSSVNVGSVSVNVTGVNLTGTDSGNYVVNPLPTIANANITKATPVISPTSLTLGLGEVKDLTTLVTSTNTTTALAFSVPVGNGIISLQTATSIKADALGNSTLTVTQAADANHEEKTVVIPVAVEEDPAVVGDYRTVGDATTTYLWNNISTWQVKTASGWVAATAFPYAGLNITLTNNIFIKNIVSFNLSNQAIYTNVTVNSGAVLNNNNTNNFIIAAGGKLLIKDGGKYYNNKITTIRDGGKLEVEDNAYFYNSYQSGSNGLAPNLFGGIEIFHPKSNLVIINAPETDTGYKSLITDFSVLTPYDDGNGNVGYFGNIIFETVANSVNLVYGKGGTTTAVSTNYNIANGDLIYNTGTAGTSIIHVNNADVASTASTATRPYKIGGSLIVKNTFTGPVRLRNSLVNTYFKVGENLEIQSGASFNIINAANNSARTLSLYVDGDMKVDGNFVFHPASSNTGTISLFLSGDLEATSGSTFANLDTNTLAGASNASIYFVGLGDGLSAATTQTVNVVPAVQRVDFILKHASYGASPFVRLLNNLTLGSRSTVTVRSTSSLDFGFNGATANNILNSASATTTTFTQQADSDLYITSPQGIQTAGATGNVQTDTRIFATATPYGDYHYIGSALQDTGDALPINARDIFINNTSNTNEVTLTNSSLSVTRDLHVQKGIFNLNDKVVVGSGAVAKVSIDGLATLKIGGSQSFPAQFGLITLSDNSTVNYSGDIQAVANAGVTGYTNMPAYYNLDISGTGAKTASGNTTVNHLTRVTGGELLIPTTADNIAPNVLTAKMGIHNTGGIVTFENNAILMQDADAANTGNVIVKRVASANPKQYNFWASPVASQALYSLYGTSVAAAIPTGKVMTYNTVNDTYTALTSASNPLSVIGKGYSIISIDLANLTANFNGVPNNGNLEIGLSTEGRRFNLIGNPYPSNLNLDQLYQDNNANLVEGTPLGTSNVTPTMYFWDNTNNAIMNQQGSGYGGQNYAIYNAAGQMGTSATASAGSQTKVPNGIVKPGQGFIVKANSTGNKKVLFNNNQRVTIVHKDGVDAPYYKNATDNDKYWLTLETPTGIVNMLAVGYFAKASNLSDIYDSSLLNNAANDLFYTISDDAVKLGIQGRKGNFEDTDIVKVGLRYNKDGQHKIQLMKKAGVFDAGQSIYLHDKKLGEYINLTNGAYTFDATKATDDTRFEIVYKSEIVLGTDAVDAKNDLEVYKSKENFVVRSSKKNITKVELYDMNGRLILVNDKVAKELSISHQSLSNGAYVLKIYRDQEVNTKKVLK